MPRRAAGRRARRHAGGEPAQGELAPPPPSPSGRAREHQPPSGFAPPSIRPPTAARKVANSCAADFARGLGRSQGRKSAGVRALPLTRFTFTITLARNAPIQNGSGMGSYSLKIRHSSSSRAGQARISPSDLPSARASRWRNRSAGSASFFGASRRRPRPSGSRGWRPRRSARRSPAAGHRARAGRDW